MKTRSVITQNEINIAKDILKIPRDQGLTEQLVNKSYRQLMLENHPDRIDSQYQAMINRTTNLRDRELLTEAWEKRKAKATIISEEINNACDLLLETLEHPVTSHTSASSSGYSSNSNSYKYGGSSYSQYDSYSSYGYGSSSNSGSSSHFENSDESNTTENKLLTALKEFLADYQLTTTNDIETALHSLKNRYYYASSQYSQSIQVCSKSSIINYIFEIISSITTNVIKLNEKVNSHIDDIDIKNIVFEHSCKLIIAVINTIINSHDRNQSQLQTARKSLDKIITLFDKLCEYARVMLLTDGLDRFTFTDPIPQGVIKFKKALIEQFLNDALEQYPQLESFPSDFACTYSYGNLFKILTSLYDKAQSMVPSSIQCEECPFFLEVLHHYAHAKVQSTSGEPLLIKAIIQAYKASLFEEIDQDLQSEKNLENLLNSLFKIKDLVAYITGPAFIEICNYYEINLAAEVMALPLPIFFKLIEQDTKAEIVETFIQAGITIKQLETTYGCSSTLFKNPVIFNPLTYAFYKGSIKCFNTILQAIDQDAFTEFNHENYNCWIYLFKLIYTTAEEQAIFMAKLGLLIQKILHIPNTINRPGNFIDLLIAVETKARELEIQEADELLKKLL